MNEILRKIKQIIPKNIFNFFEPFYHYLLSLSGAIFYRFPSRKIKVIAITGTKGKSSITEIINAILEEAGFVTAVSNTIRFKIASDSEENLKRMSTPGRFAIQRFLRKALNAKCDYVIVEITSQAALQFRHRFIELDALIFTNLAPEHIEAHGSFENYKNSKLKIAKALSKSKKRPRILIVNKDDKASEEFLKYDSDIKSTYSPSEFYPYEIKPFDISFYFKNQTVNSNLSGLFNLYNICAAMKFAETQNIKTDIIIKSIGNLKEIPGRVEMVKVGQDFNVVVDYAHTPDSLQKLYEIFRGTRRICVLGGTGGGRDTWKRKEMGKIADNNCDTIILTNEDPYDENPDQIISDIKEGIRSNKTKIIMDRREAIREAIFNARTGDSIIISGKGTDPSIMGPRGTYIPWSDANVAKEELATLLKIKK
ncbi:MAG: UDP-N-acetylmuramyl-tripeptide synthetase [Patescibacteria group bacterium]